LPRKRRKNTGEKYHLVTLTILVIKVAKPNTLTTIQDMRKVEMTVTLESVGRTASSGDLCLTEGAGEASF
jgi:hypothetical protein